MAKKLKSLPQISDRYGINYQTLQSRVRAMGIKEDDMLGGVRLFSVKNVRRIVGHKVYEKVEVAK